MEEVRYYRRTEDIPRRECWKIVFKKSRSRHSYKLKTVTWENLQDILHNGLKLTPGTYRLFYKDFKSDRRHLVSSQREVSFAMFECQLYMIIHLSIETATSSADDSEIATTRHREVEPMVVFFIMSTVILACAMENITFKNLKDSLNTKFVQRIPRAYQIFYRDREYNKISVSSQQDVDKVLSDSEGYREILFTLEADVGERSEEINSLAPNVAR